MGHIKPKKHSTSHYMSVGGTFAVIGATFFLGFIVGLAVGSLL